MNNNKKPKSNIAAILTSIAAILAAIGTFYKSSKDKETNDLVIKSVYEINVTMYDKLSDLRERIAILEATCAKKIDAKPVKLTVSECNIDSDCGNNMVCIHGRCIMHVRANDAFIRKLPTIDKIQQQVQETGKSWKFLE